MSAICQTGPRPRSAGDDQLHPLPPTGGGRGAPPWPRSGPQTVRPVAKACSIQIHKVLTVPLPASRCGVAVRSGASNARQIAKLRCSSVRLCAACAVWLTAAPCRWLAARGVRTQHSRSGAGATPAAGATLGQPGRRDAAAGMLRGGSPHPQERVQGRSEELFQWHRFLVWFWYRKAKRGHVGREQRGLKLPGEGLL